MKKGLRTIISTILSVCILASVALSSSVTVFARGKTDPKSREISYQIAVESSLLFENNGALPLANNDKVAVFGRVQVDPIRGGYGSGDVNITLAEQVNYIDAIDSKGALDYYKPLADTYKAWSVANPVSAIPGTRPLSYPEMPLSAQMVDAAANYADTAIVVIGRSGRESADRYFTQDFRNDPNNLRGMDGDYYLRPDEVDMLDAVSEKFDKVVVVLNVATVMDMNWVDEYNPDAVLCVWLPGTYGATAAADLLVGDAQPSGKLVDSWANNYEDYPTQDAVINAQFGGSTFAKSGVNPVYAEDVYVGYRYFETFAPDKVRYEFGFGKTYTTFEQEIINYDDSNVIVTGTGLNRTIGGTISVTVNIKNIGYYPGKEVVQAYFSAPQGQLGKPAKELASYAKTDELQPGEEQKVTLTFDASEMSSYDDGGVTGFKSAYVMEVGNYDVYVGNSVKNVEKAGTYSLSTQSGVPIVTEQLTEQIAVEAADVFQRIKPGVNGEIMFETVPTRTIPWSQSVYDQYTEISYTGDQGIKLIDVFNDPAKMDDFIAQLTDMDMATLSGGYSEGMRYEAGGSAGAYGGRTSEIAYGILSVATADGPAGIRITRDNDGNGCTQFPNAAAVATTWNLELIEQQGIAVGKEAALNDVDFWLAPGMNIHRDPIGARNFEYYSEDPFVTGMSAAAVTRGVQSQGVMLTLKHFTANSQETDRRTNNSIVSERALREIYLKGFEIAVKKSHPTGLMTCYNRVNGRFGSSNYDIVVNILRKEWGFDGVVMTDWGGAKDPGNSGDVSSDGQATMVRARCNLSMRSGTPDQVINGLNNGTLTRGQLQQNTKDILQSVMNSLDFRDNNGLSRNIITYSEPLMQNSLEEIGTWFDVADPANKEVLLDIIREAEAIVGSTEYNKTYDFIRTNFDNKLSQAKVVYNELYVTNDDVVFAALDLIDAMGYLAAQPANAAKLAALVQLADGFDLSKYNVGVAAFQTALANAKLVLADIFAEQSEVDTVYSTLLKAIAAMRYTVNKTMLQQLYDSLQPLDLSIYTAESAAVFRSAMAYAVEVLGDENVTQDNVDAAYIKLDTAKKELKPLSTISEKSSTAPNIESNKDAGAAANANTDNKDGASRSSAPKTGDYFSFIGLAAIISLAGIVFVVSKRKKSSF